MILARGDIYAFTGLDTDSLKHTEAFYLYGFSLSKDITDDSEEFFYEIFGLFFSISGPKREQLSQAGQCYFFVHLSTKIRERTYLEL